MALFKYSLLPSGEHSEDKERNSQSPVPTHIALGLAILLLSNAALAIVVVFLTLRLFQSPHNGSFETGFLTEFKPAHPAVQLHQIRFTGGLLYDENGTLYRNVNPEEPSYVGSPTEDMDAAWEALIHDRYTPLTSEEALSIGLEDYSLPSKQSYWAGVDVFHSLHCINYIRMVLDFDHYQDKIDHTPPIRRLHVDHCLDHLRQTVQCSGDLTPVPERWDDVNDMLYWDFEVPRTCRNFQSLRSWQDKRVEQMM